MLLGTGLQSGASLLKLAPSVRLADVWSVLEQMNGRCHLFARIAKNRIILINRDRSLIRTSKGTIARRDTANLHEKEVAAFY